MTQLTALLANNVSFERSIILNLMTHTFPFVGLATANNADELVQRVILEKPAILIIEYDEKFYDAFRAIRFIFENKDKTYIPKVCMIVKQEHLVPEFFTKVSKHNIQRVVIKPIRDNIANLQAAIEEFLGELVNNNKEEPAQDEVLYVHNGERKKQILIKLSGRSEQFIPEDEIVYVERIGKQGKIIMKDCSEIITTSSNTEILEQCSPSFFSPLKGYVVNANYISKKQRTYDDPITKVPAAALYEISLLYSGDIRSTLPMGRDGSKRYDEAKKHVK